MTWHEYAAVDGRYVSNESLPIEQTWEFHDGVRVHRVPEGYVVCFQRWIEGDSNLRQYPAALLSRSGMQRVANELGGGAENTVECGGVTFEPSHGDLRLIPQPSTPYGRLTVHDDVSVMQGRT